MNHKTIIQIKGLGSLIKKLPLSNDVVKEVAYSTVKEFTDEQINFVKKYFEAEVLELIRDNNNYDKTFSIEINYNLTVNKR